jgi:hypothetical protein
MSDIQIEIAKLLTILRKLDFPPSGPNWVRFISDDVARTAKAILKFAKGQPPFTYQPAYRGIKDRIELGVDLETAIKVATTKGAPAGRVQNRQLVEAFFEYDWTRKYSASNPIGFDTEYFRVSRDVLVPIAPISIIREKGKFVPIFVCGWTTNPLMPLQRRLLMTMYEDAFFSLTDYQSSPAEVLFFPKAERNEDYVEGQNLRDAEVWSRGEYELLAKAELNQCLEIFVLARDMAREILLEEIEALREKAKSEEVRPTLNPDDLFTKK